MAAPGWPGWLLGPPCPSPCYQYLMRTVYSVSRPYLDLCSYLEWYSMPYRAQNKNARFFACQLTSCTGTSSTATANRSGECLRIHSRIPYMYLLCERVQYCLCNQRNTATWSGRRTRWPVLGNRWTDSRDFGICYTVRTTHQESVLTLAKSLTVLAHSSHFRFCAPPHLLACPSLLTVGIA